MRRIRDILGCKFLNKIYNIAFKYLHLIKGFYGNFKIEISQIPAYSIKEIFNKNEVRYVTVQISGTGKIVNYSVNDLACDNDFLEGFSINDLKKIFKLYYQSYDFNLVREKFSNGKVILCLRNTKTGEISETTLSEISSNRELIKKLSPRDAHRIGFLYANTMENSST